MQPTNMNMHTQRTVLLSTCFTDTNGIYTQCWGLRVLPQMASWKKETFHPICLPILPGCVAKHSLQLINNLLSSDINDTDDNYHLSVFHMPDAFPNI